tara:strand:+ start:3939 stop:4583 length:645 start_codon:yes stop_codon:yes gene_type:complete
MFREYLETIKSYRMFREYVNMSDDSIDEISRLLFVSFSDLNHADISDLVRLWSLEFQWMDPKNAELVIEKLLKSGWLINEGDILKPVDGINKISPELGWRPIFRYISNPPDFISQSNDSSTTIDEPLPSKIVIKVIEPESSQVIERPPDRSEANIPNLIKLIAHKSRLENREVVRRAQRKRRSLGPVTLWMALALVAREQGLDMIEIVSVIESI